MLLACCLAVCLPQDPSTGTQAFALAAPVRLDVDGTPIDTGKDIGHSAPLVRDVNGDGRLDLLVGNFRGTVDLYVAATSGAQPQLLPPARLQAAGEPLKIPNW